MSVVERKYEARALAVHYFTHGGLPFADRTALLSLAVDADDEIERLAEQLRGAVEEHRVLQRALSLMARDAWSDASAAKDMYIKRAGDELAASGGQ